MCHPRDTRNSFSADRFPRPVWEAFIKNEQLVICQTLFLQIPLVRFCLQHRQAIDLVDHQG